MFLLRLLPACRFSFPGADAAKILVKFLFQVLLVVLSCFPDSLSLCGQTSVMYDMFHVQIPYAQLVRLVCLYCYQVYLQVEFSGAATWLASRVAVLVFRYEFSGAVLRVDAGKQQLHVPLRGSPLHFQYTCSPTREEWQTQVKYAQPNLLQPEGRLSQVNLVKTCVK